MSQRKKVLVSGASIAGPGVAYWLNRYGFDVAVVEKASTIRLGGYPIDIRGSAIGVVEKMGLLPALRKAHIETGSLTFIGEDGEPLQQVEPEEISGGTKGLDVEIPRGELSTMLYEASRDEIEYRFNDSIVSLDEMPDGIAVTFDSGVKEKYHLVIGADGLHSNTRRLIFGPEDRFLRYLGYTFAGFTMPNIIGLKYGAVLFPQIGRLAALYAVRDADTLHAFFNIARDFPAPHEMRSVETQRKLMRELYGNDGWIVPQMLDIFDTADDIYFDSVCQTHMPAWSKGRVALIGDAACAPSFMTGQGASLSLVTGYILAGEIASHDDYEEAFAQYERKARGFVERNQYNATYRSSQFIPNDEAEAEALRRRIETITFGGPTEIANEKRRIHNSLDLPDYDLL